MQRFWGFLFAATTMVLSIAASAADCSHRVINNGVPWFDTDGNIVNAHGACIVEDGGRYWLFGEYKSDQSNAFPGFGCYSSNDLVHWNFERVVLPVQPDGILGPDRVGERVKVMKCPSTGKYVMFMHADNLAYKDPNIGVAVCDSINGDYCLLGTIEYNGLPVKKWDMGVFQDTDGTGYLIIHHGPIYRLSSDYLSVDTLVADVKGMGESPAMFKHDETYFLLTSGLTSWERNDNWYFTAPTVAGPWTKRGLFCPEGSLTHNSQTTFVFPLCCGTDTVPMFMGDRWSFPHQASAATYVWMPMLVNGTGLSIPEYWESWNVDSLCPETDNRICRLYNWHSDNKDDCLRIPFCGTGIDIFGRTDTDGGYAIVRITDTQGHTIHRQYVDFYSKTPSEGLRFVSPQLAFGDYVLWIEVSGQQPVWYKKDGTRLGSHGYNVDISKISVRN